MDKRRLSAWPPRFPTSSGAARADLGLYVNRAYVNRAPTLEGAATGGKGAQTGGRGSLSGTQATVRFTRVTAGWRR